MRWQRSLLIGTFSTFSLKGSCGWADCVAGLAFSDNERCSFAHSEAEVAIWNMQVQRKPTLENVGAPHPIPVANGVLMMAPAAHAAIIAQQQQQQVCTALLPAAAVVLHARGMHMTLTMLPPQQAMAAAEFSRQHYSQYWFAGQNQMVFSPTSPTSPNGQPEVAVRTTTG